MKKFNLTILNIFILLFIFPISTKAQTEPYNCSFVAPPEYKDLSRYSGSTQRSSSTNDKYIFNVKFLLIAQNGVIAFGITERDLLETIALMNLRYNEWGIFFKYRGYSLLENSNYAFDYVNDYPSNLNNVKNDFINAGIYSPDKLNIMVLHASSGGEGYAFITEEAIKNNDHNETFAGKVIHEVGHSLGLLHTFSGAAQRIVIDNPDCNLHVHDANHTYIFKHIVLSSSENITRDVLDPNYNADSAGDCVIDTPACHYKFRYNVCYIQGGEPYNDYLEDYRVVDGSTYADEDTYYCSVSKIEYRYTAGNNYYTKIDDSGTVTSIDLNTQTWADIVNSLASDCNQILQGRMYRDLEPLCYNYMSYSCCPNYFTPGQAVRMYETIETSSILQNTLAKLPDGSPDFSVLYEPYAGSYYTAGPTLPQNRPLFQPGFDYYFVNCTGSYNVPADYDDTSFTYDVHTYNHIDKTSLDLDNITHPNHTAIFISQLNDVDLYHGGLPRKCYNNTNRAPSSGTVIKYEDGVPNDHITIHPKNQTEINDENLVPNLDNGLYLIKKKLR